MRKYLVLALVLSLVGCNDSKPENRIILSGLYFESKEAEAITKEGVRLSTSGDVEAGLEKYFEALEIEPNNTTILGNIGLSKMILLEYRSAEDYFQKALILSDSTDAIAAINMGLMYYELEKYDKGIAILDHIIEVEDDPLALEAAIINRLFNLIENGDCERAIRDLNYVNQHLEEYPNSVPNIKKLNRRIKKCR